MLDSTERIHILHIVALPLQPNSNRLQLILSTMAPPACCALIAITSLTPPSIRRAKRPVSPLRLSRSSQVSMLTTAPRSLSPKPGPLRGVPSSRLRGRPGLRDKNVPAGWLSQQKDWLSDQDRAVWEDHSSEFRSKLDRPLLPVRMGVS